MDKGVTQIIYTRNEEQGTEVDVKEVLAKVIDKASDFLLDVVSKDNAQLSNQSFRI